MVARILCELDPVACQNRRTKRLKKRKYSSQGPNQRWHVDGKLKLFAKILKNISTKSSEDQSFHIQKNYCFMFEGLAFVKRLSPRYKK